MNKNVLEKFLKAFRLESNAIGVSFVREKGDLHETEAAFCTAVDRVRKNIPVLLSRKSCSCISGRYWLGLSKNPAVLKDAIPKYLAEREKFFASKALARKFLDAYWPRPQNEDKYVRIEPLLECAQEPQAAVFLCNADQAGRLFGIIQFGEETLLKLMAFHSLCAVVANVITDKSADVCFIDPAARERDDFKPEEMAVVFSLERLKRALLDFERSGFGYVE